MIDDYIKQLIAAEVARQVEAIRRDLMRQATKTEPTEVQGNKAICDALNINRNVLTYVASNGILGDCIWKHKTPSGKWGKTICTDIPRARQRIRHFLNLSANEAKIWAQLGSQQAETEWQRQNL